MKKVLFVNSKVPQDGLTDYGRRFNAIIQKSSKHKVKYVELMNVQNLDIQLSIFKPDIVIYNYHVMTFGNMQPFTTSKKGQFKQMMIYHEFGASLDVDGIIHVDSTKEDDLAKKFFSMPRPVFDYVYDPVKNEVPNITSYGFGGYHKNFDKSVSLICEQFEKAKINFNIPKCYFDYDINIRRNIINTCNKIVESSNKDIQINITEDFLEGKLLTDYLSKSDLIIFSHADRENANDLTLSASTDYAMEARRPIALSKSNMFRHFDKANPSVYTSERSLPEILESGVEALSEVYKDHCEDAFRKKFDYIIDQM